jgi:hypothetical protein
MIELQYYPTPITLAIKAWAKFQNSPEGQNSRVLEPSAGKGALLDGLPHNCHYRAPKVDACEVNAEFHPLLRGKEVNVVGFNFLTMESLAQYSHIIMNPPFAEGCAHVLKAWDGLYDGEVVAIINAETLRNPFSLERRRLAGIIKAHGTAEFLRDEFLTDEAERKTPVEIALVWLQKKAETHHVFDIEGILGALKADKETGAGLGADTAIDDHAVAISGTQIENKVRDFEIAVRTMRELVYAEVRAAHYAGVLGSKMAGSGRDVDEQASTNSGAWIRKEIGQRYNELKDRAWTFILRSSDVMPRLSSSAQARVTREFENIKQLEFSATNIYGFLCGLIEQEGDIRMGMICDVFDTITRYHTGNAVYYRGWKSNDKHCGRKLRYSRFILPHQHSTWSGGLDYKGMSLLRDFDKAFALLDGGKLAPEVSLESVFSGSVDQLCRGERLSSSYFDVRFYPGIGTIHFYPRDKKFIDALNLAVGQYRKWLPKPDQEAPGAFWEHYKTAEKTDAACSAEYTRRCAMKHDRYSYDYVPEEEADGIRAEAIEAVLAEQGVDIFGALESAGNGQQRLLLEAA